MCEMASRTVVSSCSGLCVVTADTLSPSQQGFIEAQLVLFDAWYADWCKTTDALKFA